MIQGGIIEQLELNSNVESLSKLEGFVERVHEQNSMDEASYGNILIALTEAVNNAINHGNKFDPSKKVNLNMETTSNNVVFTVKDEGAGFDFNNVPDPTLPENLEKLNGRGVFLIKNLADRVVFEENGTVVRLTFSLSNS